MKTVFAAQQLLQFSRPSVHPRLGNFRTQCDIFFPDFNTLQCLLLIFFNKSSYPFMKIGI